VKGLRELDQLQVRTLSVTTAGGARA
jgi:hypothetical protein